MNRLDLGKLEQRFPAIYVTLISVLLGLVLEDMASQLRDAGTYDSLTWAIALYVTTITIASWTTYTFVAITQVRRPRVLDSLNVFLVAATIYLMSSCFGKTPDYFFSAVALYNLAALYSTHYNMRMLAQVMPFRVGFKDIGWTYSIPVFTAIAYPFITALAHNDLTPALVIVFAYLPSALTLVSVGLFRQAWKNLLDRAEAMQAQATASTLL